MPSSTKIQKEDILNIAFKIAEKEGMEGINARIIAKKLKCSVQPIFYQFSNMEELRKAVYKKIYEVYKNYMLSGRNKECAYREIGISYIKFAKDYPEFFKEIFMKKPLLDKENLIIIDNVSEEIIKAGQEFSGLSFEEQKKFHTKVWIFTHGIATLVVTKTIEFSEEEIKELLSSTVSEMIQGYKKINKI